MTRMVKLDARLPLSPIVEKLPLHVGVHYSPEFLVYVRKFPFIMCADGGRSPISDSGMSYAFPVGTASKDLFDQVIASMFTIATRSSDQSSPLSGVTSFDGVFELQIVSFDWASSCFYGKWTPKGRFITRVSYTISLYSKDGHLVTSMNFNGEGSEKYEVCFFVDCEKSLATEEAMLDAMAKFMIEFREQPEVKRWLSTLSAGQGNNQ
jgi:hypothetical protein